MTNFFLITDIDTENLKQQIKLLKTDLNNLTNEKDDFEKKYSRIFGKTE